MRGSEVLKALEDGKKVRISTWQHDQFIKGNNGRYVGQNDLKAWLGTISDLYDYEWELYNEKLTYYQALEQLKPGDLVRVVFGGNGATGLNNRKGKIVTQESVNGVNGTFLKVRTDDSVHVWGLPKDCLVEKL